MATSVAANFLRAIIAFFTSLAVARGLAPDGFGNMSFLIGSFVSIRSFLDAGSSQAFFTFISQRPRGSRFYLFYFAIQASQFLLALIVVAVLIPDELFQEIWVGQMREVTVMALVAAYMQQSVWQMIGQIGEAVRKTLVVQVMNVAVAVSALGVVITLNAAKLMSVENMLVATGVQYLIATCIGYFALRDAVPLSDENAPLIQTARDFWRYCKPMLWLSVFGAVYLFIDKWVLQVYGGSVEQGYFQVASQFSLIGLLITSSVLGVFWKEIAAAWAVQDHKRVARLYLYASRGLLVVGSFVAGVLLPWSEEIVLVLLGNVYRDSWQVVGVMALCPIFQSLSQINASMLLACERSKVYTAIGVFGMIISAPLSYFVVAPTLAALPGLGLGALGIAIKEVSTTVLMASIQGVAIAAYHGLKFDGLFQLSVVPSLLGLGWISKICVGIFLGKAVFFPEKLALVLSIVFSAFMLLVVVILFVWWQRKRYGEFLGLLLPKLAK